MMNIQMEEMHWAGYVGPPCSMHASFSQHRHVLTHAEALGSPTLGIVIRALSHGHNQSLTPSPLLENGDERGKWG